MKLKIVGVMPVIIFIDKYQRTVSLTTTYINERQKLHEVPNKYILKIWNKKTVSCGWYNVWW
jgi:hypothetical protein